VRPRNEASGAQAFGQHFLSDSGIIDAIVQAIDPQPGDPMVEIGPGLAALTQPLVERLGRLTVIELDRDLAKRLRSHPQLHVIESDVLNVDFSSADIAPAAPENVATSAAVARKLAGGGQLAVQHLNAHPFPFAGLRGSALETSISCCKRK